MPDQQEFDLEREIEQGRERMAAAARQETESQPKRRTRALVFRGYVLIALIVFAALAFLARTTPYFQIDLAITQALQNNIPAPMQMLMRLVSWPGYAPQVIVIPIILALLLAGFGFQWEALVSGATAGGALLFNTLLKIAIQRPRPPDDLVSVLNDLQGFSFPSGHVMFYTGFIGFLWFLSYTLLKSSWRRTALLWVFGGLVVLVGPSRVLLGEHWASDVLGGYLMGGLILALFIQLYSWGKPRFLKTQPATGEDEIDS